MLITKVKNAIKVADASLNSEGKLKFIWLPHVSRQTLSDSSGRVYIFVLDGAIKKIGGSQADGGIKKTMDPYATGDAGDPSESRFAANYEIKEALKNGHKIELFLITSPKVKARVNGLFSSKEIEVAPFQEMETMCKDDYQNSEGKYPDWNYKENNKRYPEEIKKEYVKYKGTRTRS
jgi:hypothetical protein